MERISIVRTKEGIPALWEKGGFDGKEGYAEIIAGSQGNRLVPLRVKRFNLIPNRGHALLEIKEGYYIARARAYAGEFYISLYRIERIEGEYAYIEKIAELSEKGWDVQPPDFLLFLVGAAKIKSTWYKCREPLYVEIPLELSNKDGS